MRRRTEEAPVKPWLKYAIGFGITSVLVLLYLWGMGMFKATTDLEKIRIFSDGCFTIGIMTACMGGLMFVSSQGTFDGLMYSMKQFIWLFRIQGFSKKHESFHEYKKRLSEKPKAPFFFLVVIGLFWIAVAAIFVLLFMRMDVS